MWKWCLAFAGPGAGAAAGQPRPWRPPTWRICARTSGACRSGVADLTLRVEQLEAETGALRDKTKAAAQDCATVAELNDAVARMSREIQSAVATSKDETLRQVAAQMEKLARQTNAALDALGRNPAQRPSSATFSEEFPKEGVSYTVQKGDTLASIAKKTGAKVQDIINANKIADPARIMVGQTLFIPGGK